MPVQFENFPIINPGERHLPVILLVDTSGSMTGQSISEVNAGIKEFCEALKEDAFALGRVEVSIISFSDCVRIEHDFCPASEFMPPHLKAGGLTVLNQALLLALDTLNERKKAYRENGVSYYRPWLFLLTDGDATDGDYYNDARSRISKEIRDKRLNFLPMAIGSNVNVDLLRSYYPQETDHKVILSAEKKNFKDAFVWLSSSVSVVSHTKMNSDGDQVQLPPTPSIITVGI